MTKAFIVTTSCMMIIVGLVLYFTAHRQRQSLNVPLLSKHAKLFIGGSLVFFGLGLLSLSAIK